MSFLYDSDDDDDDDDNDGNGDDDDGGDDDADTKHSFDARFIAFDFKEDIIIG